MLFWLPPIASAVLLFLSHQMGLIQATGKLLLWFLLALLLQFLFPVYSPLWALGLASQSALGVYLAIKLKIG